MNCLLLGGTGFIGKHIQQSRLNWNWTVINRSVCDLSDDSCVDVIDGNYDVIINSSGWYGGIVFNQIHQKEILYYNTKIHMNVCKIAFRLKPKKLINIGSACVYPNKEIIHENDLKKDFYHSSVLYSALSKIWMLDMMQTLDIPWEYLILGNVYGPGEHTSHEQGHFVGSVINKIKNAKDELNMFGTGSGIRDFLYINDAAESIARYAELENATNSHTNISSGKGYKISDITEKLVRISNKDLDIKWGNPADNGVDKKILDNSKMMSDIGNTVNTDIDTGLNKTWNWFKN
jgi:nucleoside-diphosphate-sugar epimerase